MARFVEQRRATCLRSRGAKKKFERPHQVLEQKVTAAATGEALAQCRSPAAVAYDDGEIVRSVSNTKAYVSFKGSIWKVPEAFVANASPCAAPRESRYGDFFGAY